MLPENTCIMLIVTVKGKAEQKGKALVRSFLDYPWSPDKEAAQ